MLVHYRLILKNVFLFYKLGNLKINNQNENNNTLNKTIGKLQKQLEEMAKQEEKNGGSYIRPIVLFQAEPKNAEDATTFQDIKNKHKIARQLRSLSHTSKKQPYHSF